jgi:hypothetical protein
MDMVFEYLNMTRIYTKPKGQMPDYETPVIIRGNVRPTVTRTPDLDRTSPPTPYTRNPCHHNQPRLPSRGPSPPFICC